MSITTIKDIADAANVSSATVSRVLNADTGLQVSSATRQRIFAAAESLNYTKHQHHSKQTNGTVAILQWYSPAAEMNDLYYRNIRWGVETQLANQDFQIQHSFKLNELPPTNELAGIIAIGKFSPQQLASLQARQLPLVVVDQNTLTQGINCVTTDFATPIHQIVARFLKQGHTAIGMLAGAEKTTDLVPLVDPRTVAFQTELIMQHRFEADNLLTGQFTIESGYQLMQTAIQKLGSALPTAFFVANDTLAIGAIKALQEHHLSIPDRVSLIGFNDLAVGRYLSPSLSTVHVATTEMGQAAVNLLQQQRDAVITTPMNLQLSSQLIIRESSH